MSFRQVTIATLALACSVPAAAQVQFTDRAAFTAAAAPAATATYTYNFDVAGTNDFAAPFAIASSADNAGVGSYVTAAAAPETVVDGTRFLAIRLDPQAGPGAFALSSTQSFYAFGFDINPYRDSGFSDLGEGVTFTASNGQTGTFTLPTTDTTEFRGFVFNSPITSVSFRSNGTDGGNATVFGTDNWTIYSAAVAAVPEPASWALLIGGFGAVGAARRRRGRGVARTA